MLGPYRNLVDGLWFGLALFIGALAGIFYSVPILLLLRSTKWEYVVFVGCALGCVAGGLAWKLLSMRYRVRTLLIVITGMCLVLGFWSWDTSMYRLVNHHRQIGWDIEEDVLPRDPLEAQKKIRKAKYHRQMADRYEDSIYRPWVLLKERPEPLPEN
jgi:hypothetical protein